MMTVDQVICFNVQCVTDDLHIDWSDKRDRLVWIINHRFPPYQGDLALANGLDPSLLPKDCRR